MKSILLTAILFASSFAAASTHFDDLIEKFKMGTAMTSSQLEGAYIGRCFYGFEVKEGQTPDSAMVSLIIGKTFIRSGDSNAGPLYPPKKEARLMVNIFSAIDGEDFEFDKLTEAQALSLLRADNGVKSTPVSFDGQSMTWTSVYDPGVISVKFEARNYAGYIVVKSSLTKDIKDTAAHAGDVYATCYFYEKLK